MMIKTLAGLLLFMSGLLLRESVHAFIHLYHFFQLAPSSEYAIVIVFVVVCFLLAGLTLLAMLLDSAHRHSFSDEDDEVVDVSWRMIEDKSDD